MSKKLTSVKITQDMHARLEVCADRVGITRTALIESAIEAAVSAIEHNGYKVVMPIEFEIKSIAVTNPFPGTVTLKKSAAA